MRTREVELLGERCLLCFSNRVVQRCIERTGGMDFLEKLFDQKDPHFFENTMWLLAEMTEAGARYAKRNGLGEYGVIGYEDLLDGTDIDDLAKLQRMIGAAVSAGSKADVEVEEVKNAKTTLNQRV